MPSKGPHRTGPRRAVACAGHEARSAPAVVQRRCAVHRMDWGRRTAAPRCAGWSATSRTAGRPASGESGYGPIGSGSRSRDIARPLPPEAPGSRDDPGCPPEGSRRDSPTGHKECSCLPRWEGERGRSSERVNPPRSTRSEEEPVPASRPEACGPSRARCPERRSTAPPGPATPETGRSATSHPAGPGGRGDVPSRNGGRDTGPSSGTGVPRMRRFPVRLRTRIHLETG